MPVRPGLRPGRRPREPLPVPYGRRSACRAPSRRGKPPRPRRRDRAAGLPASNGRREGPGRAAPAREAAPPADLRASRGLPRRTGAARRVACHPGTGSRSDVRLPAPYGRREGPFVPLRHGKPPHSSASRVERAPPVPRRAVPVREAASPAAPDRTARLPASDGRREGHSCRSGTGAPPARGLRGERAPRRPATCRSATGSRPTALLPASNGRREARGGPLRRGKPLAGPPRTGPARQAPVAPARQAGWHPAQVVHGAARHFGRSRSAPARRGSP